MKIEEFIFMVSNFLINADLETEFLNRGDFPMLWTQSGNTIYFDVRVIKPDFWHYHQLNAKLFGEYLKEIMESFPERPSYDIQVLIIRDNSRQAIPIFLLEGEKVSL